jgi:uncharacterized protein YutE (UPF0331/DUF86 family)
MTKDVCDVIRRKLKELESNLIFLKQASLDLNKVNLKEDMIRYWGIERGIQICIECVIDIGNILISVTDNDKPSTYKETMLTLSRLDVIPEDFSQRLRKMVGFRNILVHDYTKIDEDIIVHTLNNELDDFIEYINYINKWLNENCK